MSSDWSAPDADGVITCPLDIGAVSTLRGRRMRRGSGPRPLDVALWPAAWRELLRDWLRQGGARRRWDGLLKITGGPRVHDAVHLVDTLLKAGQIEVEERRDRTRWQLQWVAFLDLETLRAKVGLPNRDQLRQRRQEYDSVPLQNPALAALQAALGALPAERAVRRHDLLLALDRWLSGNCSGTRRDFALFARGDTKGVSAAEWTWIEGALSLEGAGITRHTPALWLRAPLALHTATGALDLRGVPDCLGLTPETIDRISRIEGRLDGWLILENRTVFERVARQRGDADGVLWVPGFAPSWWKEGVRKLLLLSPAPACIACDPDPAGIEIALDVGQLWSEQQLGWEPWGMDAQTLSVLPRRKPLNADDHDRLQRLRSRSLPAPLLEIADWMLQQGEKGEQEGIAF